MYEPAFYVFQYGDTTRYAISEDPGAKKLPSNGLQWKYLGAVTVEEVKKDSDLAEALAEIDVQGYCLVEA